MKARLCFVGGTNLLSSNRNFRGKKNQWAVSQISALLLKYRCILMGVGWTKYQSNPDRTARWFYKNILSDIQVHSVRDSYTETMLRQAGINNVINTACPTMWDLTNEHCCKIPEDKAENVVFTLTDYRPCTERDSHLVATLLRCYRNCYFWAQGDRDLAYLASLLSDDQLSKIHMIGPSLFQYDDILEKPISLDYIGTRLHAGIRALQKKRRSIIVAVDNRAAEKNRDFNLKVVERDQPENLEQQIHQPFRTEIVIPQVAIARWKSQFTVPAVG